MFKREIEMGTQTDCVLMARNITKYLREKASVFMVHSMDGDYKDAFESLEI